MVPSSAWGEMEAEVVPHNVWSEDRTEADGPRAWLVDADAHVRSLAVLLRLCFWTIVQSFLLEPFPSMPLSLRRLPSCACGVQVRMYEAERDFVNGYGILFQDSIGKQASVAFRRFRPAILFGVPLSFVHKVTIAYLFGVYGRDGRSWPQIIGLVRPCPPQRCLLLSTGCLSCARLFYCGTSKARRVSLSLS